MFKWLRTLAVLAGLVPAVAVAQPVFTNLPPSTVVGRLPPNSGPAQAIPFSSLNSQLGNAATPESYGAIGNNVADDTVAFQKLCADISVGLVHSVKMGGGKTYKVFSTTPANNSVLCNLGAASSVRWDFNGASFNVAYTGNAFTYIFEITGGNQIEINDLVGTAATGRHVSGDSTGVNWVVCSNQGGTGFGCTKLAVRRASVSGGQLGVSIQRTLGTGQYSHDIWVDGFFSNVGYPVSNQSDGLNTSFDIVTNNPGRSYIGYNVWGVRGRINSTSTVANTLEDVYITAYGFQGDISNNTTANIDLSYVNRQSTTYGASTFGIVHQQGDPSHSNIATTISNVRLGLDIAYNSTPSTSLLVEASFGGNGSSQSAGDPGNTNDNIIIEGKIEGDVAGTYFGCIMATSNGGCSGYNGTSKGTYNLANLQISTATKPWAIGVNATVTFQNYASPSANFPTFDGGNDLGIISLRQPVQFANTGSEPVQGTTRFRDVSGANIAARIMHANQLAFYDTNDTNSVNLSAPSGVQNYTFFYPTNIGVVGLPLVSGGSGNAHTYPTGVTISTNGIVLGAAGSAQGQLNLCPGTGANCISLQSSNSPSAWTFFLPTSAGTSGQVLQTQGAGNPTQWVNESSLLTAGTGISLSGTTNVTINTSSVPNSSLQNSSITIAIGANVGISTSGCAPVSLGGTCTLGATTDTVRHLSLGLGIAAPTAAGVSVLNAAATTAIGVFNSTAANIGGGVPIGVSITGTHNMTSNTVFVTHSFTHTGNFNAGSSGATFDGTVYQGNLGMASSVTPGLYNSFVSNIALQPAATGTLATFNNFFMGGISGGGSSPSATISTYNGLSVQNASVNALSGLTITSARGVYISGQTAGTSGYGLYVDTGSTTAAIFSNDATDSSSSTTGSVQTVGGLGVVKKINAGSTITGAGVFSSADPGGVASTNGLSNASSTTISTGVGSVKMSSANPANNAVWIKVYAGVTSYWVPGWTTNSP